MRTIIITIVTVLILTSLPLIEVPAQRQDPITEYDGIPLVIYPHRQTSDMVITYPNSLNQIEQMGVFGVVAPDILDNDEYIELFSNHHLKAIPQYNWGNTANFQDVILKYTNSHYSIWEAEGTDPAKGNASLERSPLTELVLEGNAIKTLPITTVGEPLIFGPGYPQNATYNLSHDTVAYTIEFKMMIEQTSTPQPGYLDDVVCKVMVTNKPDGDENGPGVEDTVYSKDVKVSEFNGWNNWINDISFDYGLSKYIPEEEHRGSKGNMIAYGSAYWVQFKVIWEGLDYLNLYIDKVRVYDETGRQLIEQDDPKINITTLVNTYLNHPFGESIIGWYGTDEPGSIDNYEPFRVVDSLISDTTDGNIRLHAGFTGSWRGIFAYGNLSYGMAHDLFAAEEFWLRAKPKNIQMNLYIYHNPWSPWDVDYNPNWREDNIDKYLIEWGLDNINNYDTSFAVSTQPGAYYFDENEDCVIDDYWIIPSPSQINYHVSLALLYGARELRLDPYFSSYYENCPGLLRTYGLIDQDNDTTENYNFFKNTLIPRLNGWFGKELRKIHQKEQFTKLLLPLTQPIGNYNWLESICYDGEGSQPPDFIDLGFFETHYGSLDVPYFMVASRWYNTALPGDSLLIHINKTNSGYINWNVTNYIDSAMVTIVEEGNIKMPHIVGDTRLFKVYPVVLDGGTLLADEPAGEGQVLKGDMIIDNGATLTISGNYYAQGNITIKNGSIEIYQPEPVGGNIIFQNGKRLIIEGTASISGIPGDKLILDFKPPVSGETEYGIVVKPGGTLLISYCEINDASTGILSEVNAHYLSAQYVDFNNCTSTSITILGQQSGDQPNTPPPPEIKYCSINNSGWGISVSNLSQVVIQQNQITNTDLGIYLSNVSTPLVVNNTITSSSPNLQGVLMLSCGGVVRGNFITGHTNAIQLGNSSPDIGGNTIENNFNRGLYIGAGSLPNLRGKIVQDPIYPNIFYAVSGYNKIKDNGGLTQEDLGSEIYLYHSNVLIKGGCNEITDQRVPDEGGVRPLYNTQVLMDGEGRITGNEVYAQENFWDEHPIYPLEERFGDYLDVLYEPVLSEPCPQPQGDDDIFLLTSSSGNVVDTIYAEERQVGSLSSTELLYAGAEEKFLSADYGDAEIIYNQIAEGNDSIHIKLDAYFRLYEIGRLTFKPETYFDDLYNTFITLEQSTEDSLMKKIFSQLGSLSLIGKEEYVPAINIFDEIVQQTQGTEEAVYAEIDAITASLLVEGNDSTLQKGSLKKYLIKTSGDYFSKLDEILRKNFGNGNQETEKEILPTEYTLYQNFPNPFNPTTTIKYDLPNTSEVSLIIYDILGRKVKSLVNENQQAGRYELSFNASGLASGVYVYQLRTEKYVNTKKMILLR